MKTKTATVGPQRGRSPGPSRAVGNSIVAVSWLLACLGTACNADESATLAQEGASSSLSEGRRVFATSDDGTSVEIRFIEDTASDGDGEKGSREKGETDCTRAAKSGAGRTDLEARCAYARANCDKTDQKILGCANKQKRGVMKSEVQPREGSSWVFDGVTWIITGVVAVGAGIWQVTFGLPSGI